VNPFASFVTQPFPASTVFPVSGSSSGFSSSSFGSSAATPLFTPFLPRPPDVVPFVPVVAPLDPMDLDAVNSGTSSHSDTDSEYEREHGGGSGGDDDEVDGESDEQEDESQCFSFSARTLICHARLRTGIAVGGHCRKWRLFSFAFVAPASSRCC